MPYLKVCQSIVLLFLGLQLLLQLIVFPGPAIGSGLEGSGSTPRVTVLIYHRFGESRYPSTNVSLERFEEQMAYLRDSGYRVISLAEMVRRLRDRLPFEDRTVVLTVDDGYRSVYDKAWPVLKRYGYPFTVFLYTAQHEAGNPNYLGWGQIQEMQAAGVDFQDHSFSHHRMAHRPAGMDDAAYRDWLRKDMERSRLVLAEKLGRMPTVFAVPYGEYNQAVTEEARRLGFEAVLRQDPGAVSSATDPYAIPREAILGNEWSSLEHFKKVLNRVDLPFAGMTPPPGNLADLSPAEFAVRVADPERYQPGSFGVYVSELGWKPAKVEGDRVSVAGGQLSRRLNRVAVSAWEKESGRMAVRFWLLVNDEAHRSEAQ